MEADPVSISLAYRSANRSPVDEDKISYGFKKIPADQPRVKIVKNVPEEKLWALDGSIIELKKAKAKAVYADVDDDVDDDDVAAIDDRLAPGYAELGYGPVVKRKIIKRRKSHDFQVQPLRSSRDDDRREFEDEECICKRSEIIKIADDDDNYDSPEYSMNDYDV